MVHIRRDREMKKKIISYLLLASLAITTVACQSGGEEDSVDSVSESVFLEDEKSEFIYKSEVENLEHEENMYFSISGLFGTQYVAVGEQVQQDTGELRNFIQIVDLETNSISEIELGNLLNWGYTDKLYQDANGNVHLLIYNFTETREEIESIQLVTIDSSGTELSNLDLTKQMEEIEAESGNAVISSMVSDEFGNIYLAFEQFILGLDENGEERFRFISDDRIETMNLSSDGQLYYSSKGNQTSIHLLDKETGSLEESYSENYFTHLGSVMYLEENQFTYSDGSNCYVYDLETKENTLLFQWRESVLVGNSIQDIVVKDENTIYALEGFTGIMETSLITLTKTERSQEGEKANLILATMDLPLEVENTIQAFNTSNQEYQIIVQEYIDDELLFFSYNPEEVIAASERLLIDVTSISPPDMILFSGYASTEQAILESGALVDLSSYLEERGYTQEVFVEGVYEHLFMDEKLYYLPDYFGISTQVADSRIVGEDPGWSLEEALEIANELPEGTEFRYNATKENVLMTLLADTYGDFVDENTATANFNSDAFRSLLRLANESPLESRMDGDEKQNMIQDGTLLLDRVGIDSLYEFQLIDATFGDIPYTAIGHIGVEGNGAKIYTGGDSVAIHSESKYKEATVDFIIALLEEDTRNGFSILQEEYEKIVAREMTASYEQDSNGDTLLDDQGNPVQKAKITYNYTNGFQVDVYAATEEDLATFEILLQGISTESTSNDSAIYSIVREEAASYFSGQKSLDEVIDIIQNRVTLYLEEQ